MATAPKCQGKIVCVCVCVLNKKLNSPNQYDFAAVSENFNVADICCHHFANIKSRGRIKKASNT